MKPLLLMSRLFIGPSDPKLNLGAEMNDPRVAPVVVTVSCNATVAYPSVLPMPGWPNAPSKPKLSLENEVITPGVSPDVVTVSRVPELIRLSVDNVRVHEKPVEVVTLDAPAGYISVWLKTTGRQPRSAGKSRPNPSTQERSNLAPHNDKKMR